MADPAPTLTADSFKILHVEDDLGDAQLLRALIPKSSTPDIHLHHVDRLHEALRFLGKHSVDLIFLDVELPDAVAIKFDVVALRRCSRAPIILMTGMNRDSVSSALDRHPSLGYENKNMLTTERLTALVEKHAAKPAETRTDQPVRNDALQLENLLNSISDAVIVIDENAKAHWANDAGWTLLEQDWIDDLKNALSQRGAMPSGLVVDIANRSGGTSTRYEAKIDPFRGVDTDHLMIVTLRRLRD